MSPDEADIELAKPCDSDAVSALVHAAYAHYVSLIGREPAPMTVDYQALIARGVVYVLRDRGQREIHGVLVMFPERDAMLLDNLAIRPDYQKQGLGRRLHYAEQQALRRGLREIQLYTNEAMTENIGYCKRAGYEEIARRTEQGFRRVFMRKVLSPGMGSR